MTFGIAGKENLAQAVMPYQSGRQEVVGVGERANRMVGVAADDQNGPYLCFARGTMQEVVRLCEARQPTDRDMRHRVKAGLPQSGTGSDDVVMRDASRVVDEHGRTGVEQLAQPLSGEIVSWRDLDRARSDQLPDTVVPPREIGRRTRFFGRGAHQLNPRLREMT